MSKPYGETPVKVYIELIVCLDDNTWYLADTVIEMDWWDYHENFDNAYTIQHRAQLALKVPENAVYVSLYHHQDVTGVAE